MREGEGDDLPGIGGIGEDLLIAGHGGIEADLADRGTGGAEPETLQHGSVGQHQKGRGLGLSPSLAGRPGGGVGFRLGHGLLVAYYVGRGKGRSGATPSRFKSRKGAPVLRDDINNALKEAMKAKNERAVSTLRMVNSTLKNADIEARGAASRRSATPTCCRCCRR